MDSIPAPVVRLMCLLGVLAFNIALRDGGRAVSGAYVIFHPNSNWPDLERSHIPRPDWLAVDSRCVIPDWGPASDAATAPVTRMCLPDAPAARRKESKRLDQLADHMRAEMVRLRLPSLHARHVGVPLAIVLHGNLLMLNPRIVAASEPSQCLVRTSRGDVWQPYHKRLTMQYDTASGAVYTYEARGLEACGLENLV